jgi:hypothetical protein
LENIPGIYSIMIAGFELLDCGMATTIDLFKRFGFVFVSRWKAQWYPVYLGE